jgi:hypothetical protein
MTRTRCTRRPAQDLLERRYRRLLAAYPAAYRAANEDEMLGVALAGAAPGQRGPGLAEAVSLVLSGARLRLRGLLAGMQVNDWRDAAAVFGLIGPILITALYAESVAGQVASGWVGTPTRLSVSTLALAAGWSLVAGAAILRWRWAAAAGASLGAVGEAARMAVLYASNPSYLVVSWWQLMLAMMTALAAVTLLVGAGSAKRPLSWRVITALLAAAAVLAAAPAIESPFTTVTMVYGGGASVSNPLFGIWELLRKGLFIGLAGTVLAAVAQLDAAARRRVVVLAVPAAAAATLTAWGFGGFLASSQRFVHPLLLTAPQWAALGAVPVLALAAGMALLSRHEQMLRQVRHAGAARETSPPTA